MGAENTHEITISLISRNDNLLNLARRWLANDVGPEITKLLSNGPESSDDYDEWLGNLIINQFEESVHAALEVSGEQLPPVTNLVLKSCKEFVYRLAKIRNKDPFLLVAMVDSVTFLDLPFTFLIAVRPASEIIRVLKVSLENLVTMYTSGASVLGMLLLSEEDLQEIIKIMTESYSSKVAYGLIPRSCVQMKNTRGKSRQESCIALLYAKKPGDPPYPIFKALLKAVRRYLSNP